MVAANKLPGCDQLFARYDNSSWWWGALGNCKTGPGGETDRTRIFNCAWAQVPPNDQTDCLREKLTQTVQTSQGIDAVIAYNTPPTCDQLFVSYNNSSWWWGAFGNCKTGPGGTGDRTAIFECAWAQVPSVDRTDCLKQNLLQTIQTSQGIDAVVAYNSPTGSTFSLPEGGQGSTVPAEPSPAAVKPCGDKTHDGRRATFYFDVFCGQYFIYALPAEACTRPEARKVASTLLGYGCHIAEPDGEIFGYDPPKPDSTIRCMQELFKFCVSCDNGLGPFYSEPSTYACTESEASDKIEATRPSFCRVKVSKDFASCP